jgi:hypothetical protein
MGDGPCAADHVGYAGQIDLDARSMLAEGIEAIAPPWCHGPAGNLSVKPAAW